MADRPSPDWFPVDPERLPSREQLPSPGRREAVLAVVLLLVLAGVWVRLADPHQLRGPPPTVDSDDQPAEIAADAAERLRYVDYTYTFTFENRSGPGLQAVMKVDNTDEELYRSYGQRERRYGTEGAAWVTRYGEDWVETDVGLYGPDTAAPFDLDVVRSADVTVRQEEDGTLMVAVDDTATVREAVGRPADEARLELYVDTRAGRLESARLYRVVGDVGGWWAYEFYDYGETEVDRPPGVPGTTLEEAFRDIVRG